MKPILLMTLTCAITLPLFSAVSVERFHKHDFTFRRAPTGNRFDVTMAAEFTGPHGKRFTLPGFYDGDGAWISVRTNSILTMSR